MYRFAISCLVVVTLACEPTQLSPVTAALVVSPETASITALVAQDVEITFRVENVGRATATDVTAALSGDDVFQLVALGADELLPNAVTEFVVRARSYEVGTVSTVLAVRANDVDDIAVPLSVDILDGPRAAICVDPQTIDFRGVDVDTSTAEVVRITNCGAASLLLDGLEIVPDIDGDETIGLQAGIPPQLVAPAGNVDVPVQYASSDLNAHGANLAILSNADGGAPFIVRVAGYGRQLCPTAELVLVDPEEYEPFETVRLDASSSAPRDDAIALASFEWTLSTQPPGSTTELESNTDQASFVVDLLGHYEVTLDVVDADGTRACTPSTVSIDTVPSADLVVELIWDAGFADIDLHTIRADGTPFSPDDDVYFANPAPQPQAPWSVNPLENPFLRRDDTLGYGPEHIRIEQLTPGSSWTLSAHYFADGSAPAPSTTVTMRVHMQGMTTELQTLLVAQDTLWRAFRVDWNDGDAEPNIVVIDQLQ